MEVQAIQLHTVRPLHPSLSQRLCPIRKETVKNSPRVSEHWTDVKRRWWSSERNEGRSRNEHWETYHETTLKSFHCEVCYTRHTACWESFSTSEEKQKFNRTSKPKPWSTHWESLFLLWLTLRSTDDWWLWVGINEKLITHKVMIRSFSSSVMLERNTWRILHLSGAFGAVSHFSALRSSSLTTSNDPFFTSLLCPTIMKIFPLNVHCQALTKRKQ